MRAWGRISNALSQPNGTAQGVLFSAGSNLEVHLIVVLRWRSLPVTHCRRYCRASFSFKSGCMGSEFCLLRCHSYWRVPSKKTGDRYDATYPISVRPKTIPAGQSSLPAHFSHSRFSRELYGGDELHAHREDAGKKEKEARRQRRERGRRAWGKGGVYGAASNNSQTTGEVGQGFHFSAVRWLRCWNRCTIIQPTEAPKLLVFIQWAVCPHLWWLISSPTPPPPTP